MGTLTSLGLVQPADGDNMEIQDLRTTNLRLEQLLRGKGLFPYIRASSVNGDAAQSIPNGITPSTKVTGWKFLTSTAGGDGASAAPTNIAYSNGDFTVPYTGVYHIECRVRWEQSGIGSRYLTVYLNDNDTIAQDVIVTSAGGSYTQFITTDAQLLAGDKVAYMVAQSSGAALDLVRAADYHFNSSIRCCIRLDG